MSCLVRHIRPCKHAGGDIIVPSSYVCGPAHTDTLQHDGTGTEQKTQISIEHTEVTAHDAVPCCVVLLVELLLDESCYVLLDVVPLESLQERQKHIKRLM